MPYCNLNFSYTLVVIRYGLAVKISNLDFIAIVANEFCAHMPQVGFLGQKA